MRWLVFSIFCGGAFEGVTTAQSPQVLVSNVFAFHDSCGLGEGGCGSSQSDNLSTKNSTCDGYFNFAPGYFK